MPSHHPTPRCFIVRHGETEWSLNGRHTGVSDIPLTANGEKRIIATGKALVGEDRLISRENLAAVFVSPRTRAQRTLELLMEAGGAGRLEVLPEGHGQDVGLHEVTRTGGLKAQTTEDVREWDYGDYEGLFPREIQEDRQEKGLGKWQIWRDGCPGGESPEQVMARLDRIIKFIRDTYHRPALEHPDSCKDGERCPPVDVMVVAHGHILRAFAARWVGRDIRTNPQLILDAGGVGCLSYEHRNVEEPATSLGGAFIVKE